MADLFTAPLRADAEFKRLANAIREGVTPCSVFGVSDSQKPHMTAALASSRPVLYVTYGPERAEAAANDLAVYLGREAVVLPARQTLLGAQMRSRETDYQRVAALCRLLDGETVVCADVEALLQSTARPAELKQARLTLDLSSHMEPVRLAELLVRMGYIQEEPVQGQGQYAVRGGIVDIFPVGFENPVRVEFFDDEIDSIRLLDAVTQRSVSRLERLELLPARELCPDKKQCRDAGAKLQSALHVFLKKARPEAGEQAGNLFEAAAEALSDGDSSAADDSLFPFFEGGSVLDFLPEDCIVVADEPRRLRERAENLHLEFQEIFKDLLEKGRVLPAQAALLKSYEELLQELKARELLAMQSITATSGDISPRFVATFAARSMQSFQNKCELLAQELTALRLRGFRTVIAAGGASRARRLCADLEVLGVPAEVVERADLTVPAGGVYITPHRLTRGFEYTEIRFALITEQDIFTGVQKKKVRRARVKKGAAIDSFVDLSFGDYVVHETNGIGIYQGIVKIQTDGINRDFICIAYQGGDKLYVPVEQLDVVQKYIGGGEEHTPKVNRLGSREWQNTKARVKKSIRDMTEELTALYKQRETVQGYAFGADTPWQRQFEDDFPYEETPDQLTCIDEIKADMERPRVMDRLLCGDVGYGKTEVALRAAFKAVMDGKQVALLAPTTILAQQHYNTIAARVAQYSVRVEVLSRFKTAADAKRIKQELKAGTLDILVGTHALLAKDVVFKDLGLLIIDEEQRFGVAHKERLKQLKQSVDVLTLSATPIPRTLHMSLIGVRDMSVIENPPQERYPVQTYVVEYNTLMVRDAILRELGRGGQVYFVYNQVMGIDSFAAKLGELVPQARIAVGHGQMAQGELEKIMLAFYNGEYDVLLCTTIIESGLDIPRVNTMIVYDADHFGLAQLYQLRGRVGRSNRLAYAYFTFRRDKVLTETAQKRLEAIREFTEFGSGFKIAMRDLEIRGAGNLLGGEQHGHMAQIGYELYCKLIKETVAEAQGAAENAHSETQAELKIEAYIDEKYIANQVQKLNAYKRIATIETKEEMEDLLTELIDRYGDPPPQVIHLLTIAYLRALAGRCGIVQIRQTENEMIFLFAENAQPDFAALTELIGQSKRALSLSAGRQIGLVLKTKGMSSAAILDFACRTLENFVNKS